MQDLYLVSYSVKGIKTLDELITLSFYKKVISNDPDTQEYNVKGIYGMNGSGKSGIVTSVNILRNLLVNPGYLNNPIAQKNLDEIINKKIGELFIEAEYINKSANELMFFRYRVTVSKDNSGKYVISQEELSSKRAVSKSSSMETIFKIIDGEIVAIKENGENALAELILAKTTNLLSAASMCALFFTKVLGILLESDINWKNALIDNLAWLRFFGKKLHVYLDESDDHRDYLIYNSFGYLDDLEKKDSKRNDLLRHFFEMDSEQLVAISVARNVVGKSMFESFARMTDQLCEFIQIFKPDLQRIDIDKKEDQNVYVCNLVMVYESYRIDAEFESTGIKKLIRLFVYLREMVQGGIVFIDEFDSNLHDVYLCALLEYLMEYGKGQLCFTTHNVGPMDILKHHKKSIDFLSVDHKIYPWRANGNYSPSKLYRNGMIEGSPFNVDSIDFIGVFGSQEEEH